MDNIKKFKKVNLSGNWIANEINFKHLRSIDELLSSHGCRKKKENKCIILSKVTNARLPRSYCFREEIMNTTKVRTNEKEHIIVTWEMKPMWKPSQSYHIKFPPFNLLLMLSENGFIRCFMTRYQIASFFLGLFDFFFNDKVLHH